MLTAASADPPPWVRASPWQRTLAVTLCSHPQQANSRVTFRSIITDVSSPVRRGAAGERAKGGRPGGSGPEAPRRKPSLAFLLGTVLGTCLLAVRHPLGVQHAPDDVV